MSIVRGISRRHFAAALGIAAIVPVQALADPYTTRSPSPSSTSLLSFPAVRVVGDMAPTLSHPINRNLILCMDGSGSMTQSGSPNFAIQRDGTAAALESDDVVQKIESMGGIGVTCLQFGSGANQTVGWAFIRNKADARKYAGLIRSQNPYPVGGSTYISTGLLLSEHLLAGAPFQCNSGVVDVSGDGVNDGGPDALKDCRVRLAFNRNARVNGLAMTDKRADLDQYFRENLITTEEIYADTGVPAGRVWVVANMNNYHEVMVRKLEEEIIAMPAANNRPSARFG